MIPKSSLLLFADRAIKIPFGYLVTILIANIYSSEQIGSFALALSISTVMAIVGDYGTSQILARPYLRKGDTYEGLVLTCISIRAGIGSALLGSLLVLAPAIENSQLRWSLIILALSNLLLSIVSGFRQFIIDHGSLKSIGIADNLGSWVALALKNIFIIVKLPIYTQAAALIPMHLCQLPSIVNQIKGNSKMKCWKSLLSIGYVLETSSPYFISSMVVFIYYKLDQIILAFIHGASSLAPYSLSVSIIESSTVFFPVITSIFSAKIYMASTRHEKSISIRRMNLLLYASGLGVATTLYACSVYVFPVIFKAYSSIPQITTTLLPCVIITAISSSIILQIQGMNSPLSILKANSVTALVTLILVIPLCYYLSGLGAAIATTLSSMLLPFLLLYFYRTSVAGQDSKIDLYFST